MSLENEGTEFDEELEKFVKEFEKQAWNQLERVLKLHTRAAKQVRSGRRLGQDQEEGRLQ